MEIPTQTTDSTEAGKARRKPGTRRLQDPADNWHRCWRIPAAKR